MPTHLSFTRRLLPALIGAGALVAGVLGGLPAANAQSPGCTIATATPLDLGVANALTPTCAGEHPDWSFSYVDMGAGDTLVVDVDARALARNWYDFRLYNPGVTDFTRSSTNSICSDGSSKGQMERYTCHVYETGRFIIMWDAYDTSVAGVVAVPYLYTAPRQAGMVPGACRLETAPMAPYGVTQYPQTDTCNPSSRWWTLPLTAGQKLDVQTNGISVSVYQPGVTDFTLAQTNSWCNGGSSGLTTVDCGIAPVSGNYYIGVFNGEGAFTPVVTNPAPPPPPVVSTSVRMWTYKKKSRVEVDVDPNAAFEYVVVLQKSVNGAWVNYKSKTTTRTHVRFNPKRGTYRAVVPAGNGYTGSATGAVYVKR